MLRKISRRNDNLHLASTRQYRIHLLFSLMMFKAYMRNIDQKKFNFERHFVQQSNTYLFSFQCAWKFLMFLIYA